MEATATPTIINDIATTVILNLNFQVMFNLFIYSAVATGGVITASKVFTVIIEAIIRVIRLKWVTKYKDKKELAIAVIKIITEGSTTGWNVRPRDIEHIYFIARLLEGADKAASKLFDQCISSWQLCASMQDTQPDTPENIKFCQDLQKRAQEGCDGALTIVQKWR